MDGEHCERIAARRIDNAASAANFIRPATLAPPVRLTDSPPASQPASPRQAEHATHTLVTGTMNPSAAHIGIYQPSSAASRWNQGAGNEENGKEILLGSARLGSIRTLAHPLLDPSLACLPVCLPVCLLACLFAPSPLQGVTLVGVGGS